MLKLIIGFLAGCGFGAAWLSKTLTGYINKDIKIEYKYRNMFDYIFSLLQYSRIQSEYLASIKNQEAVKVVEVPKANGSSYL